MCQVSEIFVMFRRYWLMQFVIKLYQRFRVESIHLYTLYILLFFKKIPFLKSLIDKE